MKKTEKRCIVIKRPLSLIRLTAMIGSALALYCFCRLARYETWGPRVSLFLALALLLCWSLPFRWKLTLSSEIIRCRWAFITQRRRLTEVTGFADCRFGPFQQEGMRILFSDGREFRIPKDCMNYDLVRERLLKTGVTHLEELEKSRSVGSGRIQQRTKTKGADHEMGECNHSHMPGGIRLYRQPFADYHGQR